MSMEPCHSHIATALFTDTKIITSLFPEVQIQSWRNFLGSQTHKAKSSRWLHSNIQSWKTALCMRFWRLLPIASSIPSAVTRNGFGQVPEEQFEIQFLVLIYTQNSIWIFLKPIFCTHCILTWWKYSVLWKSESNSLSLKEKELPFLCSPRGHLLQGEKAYAIPIYNSGSNNI